MILLVSTWSSGTMGKSSEGSYSVLAVFPRSSLAASGTWPWWREYRGCLEAGWSSVAVPKSCDFSSFTDVPNDVLE